jgi:hypothetical protein
MILTGGASCTHRAIHTQHVVLGFAGALPTRRHIIVIQFTAPATAATAVRYEAVIANCNRHRTKDARAEAR